jgi:hypothetical protein
MISLRISDDPRRVIEGIEIAEWLLKNVPLPSEKRDGPEVTEQIRDEIIAAQKKHNLPT